MTQLVDPARIEGIVDHPRHDKWHLARAVTETETVYILHSRACLDSGRDLRDCPFSHYLDHGIDRAVWRDSTDRPVRLTIRDLRLAPRECRCPDCKGA